MCRSRSSRGAAEAAVAHLDVEDRDRVATRFLRLVHRGVGVAQQRLRGRELVAVGECHADAGRRPHLDVADFEGIGEAVAQVLGDEACPVEPLVGADHDDELVAADPADQAVRRRLGPEPLRHGHQELVAERVAVAVVHAA